jgi:hypothetical protein
MNHAAGTYSLGVDDGPSVAGRGGWINYQGTWEELVGVGLDMNWHIRAVLGHGGVAAKDVGIDAVVQPKGTMMPGSIAPIARIRNFGTAPQVDIPLTCWIGIGSGHEFTSTTSYAGPLAPGTTADVTFPDMWTGVNGNTYNVTMFTTLAGDEKPGNDTGKATVMVQSAVWTEFAKPPADVDRIVHATVYDPVHDMFYMIGGNPAGNAGTYMTNCTQYDPSGPGTWTPMAPMPTPRGWLPGSFCNGKIYMIGGHDNGGAAIAVNECFDPVANSWVATPTPLPRPRIGLAAAEVVYMDRYIYVMGGNNASSGFADVDIYDAVDNVWLVGTPLPAVAYMGSAAIIGNTIYMVQAYNGSTCWPTLYEGVIDAGNPALITWTAGPAPTEPIFNGATVALGGDIYWLGGFISAATVTNHVWKYTPSDGTITPVTPNYPATLARVNFMAARPSSGDLYVFAGDEAGNWTTPNQRYYHMSVVTGVEEQPVKLVSSIDNVIPTLVRDRVRINFTVARRGAVSLGVYDATGSLVRTLVNGTFGPGSQSATWDRTNSSGRRVANGSYFYRLSVDGRTVSSKSVLFN